MGPRALPTQGMRLTRATSPTPQAQTLCCCLARTSDTEPPIKGLGCRKNTSLLQLSLYLVGICLDVITAGTGGLEG